jgi:RNA polymerase sigma factor (sigma-70 family)
MDERDVLAGRFEDHRARLRAMAYNMLGSLDDAEDAVQDAWLRLERTDATGIDNLGGWLTTVVGRVCLDTLRRRAAQPERPLGVRLPDPVISRLTGGVDPEDEALAADALGLALLVVLDTLTPAERLAFVLHDVFSVPFDQIATVVDRSEPAARKLASRAREKVQETGAVPVADPATQRKAVEAFVTAARGGDLTSLVELLDPDVVVRADHGGAAVPQVARGASAVAQQAVGFARAAGDAGLAVVNGSVGVVIGPHEAPRTVMAFALRHNRIVEIDILTDRERLRALSASGKPTTRRS